MSAPVLDYVADTGPLLCHGALKKGAPRFRTALPALAYVDAVHSELTRRARNSNLSNLHRDAASSWLGRNLDRLGARHDLSASIQHVSNLKAALTTYDKVAGKPSRHRDANAGEAEAIVAALELDACFVCNDTGARDVARTHGVGTLWTTVDVLRAEIGGGQLTDHDAFHDYRRMIQGNFDPGEPVRGPLDF